MGRKRHALPPHILSGKSFCQGVGWGACFSIQLFQAHKCKNCPDPAGISGSFCLSSQMRIQGFLPLRHSAGLVNAHLPGSGRGRKGANSGGICRGRGRRGNAGRASGSFQPGLRRRGRASRPKPLLRPLRYPLRSAVPPAILPLRSAVRDRSRWSRCRSIRMCRRAQSSCPRNRSSPGMWR